VPQSLACLSHWAIGLYEPPCMRSTQPKGAGCSVFRKRNRAPCGFQRWAERPIGKGQPSR
jgi:hypothetical protein